ncbi:T9SS sorting signal type C domain-containing protein [Flavobacterium sp. ANB]|uniref:T9SS sorting signal type C domain-containing protein n=1 Tax=unclassified Flavobacterium TaxID=196869 RepID=UPI0012B731E7|nr:MULTISPECIES: T9SS sorting signal type C domain-containing protein [unclassified Flavobacterium]MBF4517186.1 T9SS sorting signal type C domain-containing protein [Flavobacterium sp. ANB]MTD70564.1 T9SS sorting signal type C domain-containing protein [Flavobacterium sp. LC2016-13]
MSRKLLFIFAMLFCFGFSNGATITSTGTGNWTSTTSWIGGIVPTINDDVIIAAGSTITLTTNISVKSLTINGTLLVSGDSVVSTSAGNILVVTINGLLDFNTNQSSIRFPAGTVVDINPPGKIDDTGGGCSNQVALYIGTVKFAVCVGSGNAEYTFTQLNNLGGTLQSKPASNAPLCETNTLNFTAAKDGADGTSLNWHWSIKVPGAASFVNYPDKQSVVSFVNAVSGSYEANLIYTTTYGGSVYTSSKTIFATVNAKPAVPTISASGTTTFCEGGNVTLTSVTGTSYLWSNGATTKSIVVTTSGNYSVQVTNASGCQSLASTATAVTVKTLLASPNVGTITQPTCVTPTGSVVLNGLMSVTNGQINQSGSSSQTYSASGSNYTILNLAPGTYTFTFQDGVNCPSLPTVSIVIKAPDVNIWNGTTWSKGTAPIASDIIEFAENYQSTGDLNGCSCKIKAGKEVTINATHTLFIDNELRVESGTGAKLIFENNASLIQRNNVFNTGNIIYKRTSPQIRQADYIYWSTPVTPQRLLDVSPLTSYDRFFGYNGDTWVSTFPKNNMVVGKGYIIRGPNGYSNTTKVDYTATFIGVPNNGTLSGETLTAGKYYLIGNPYPSALDADTFLNNNPFLDGTLYFWTHNTPVVLSGAYRYNANDYASYNITGGVGAVSGSTTGNNNIKPTGKIGAGQSFFAKATTNGTVSFNNLMRLGGVNNTQFYKSTANSKQATIERNRVWLNMTNAEGAFKQMLVGYIEGATNGYEPRYDGLSFDSNPYVDFYSIANGNNYVIQARALPFTDTDEVTLGYRTTIAGDFTISIDEVDGNLTNQTIYLEDKTTNVIHNLTAGNYTFKTSIGTFDTRFVLRYTNKILGTAAIENVEQTILVSAKEKIIKVKSSKENITEVSIFDITGKLLYNKKKIDSTELQISNLQSSNQVLLVKTILDNGNITTTKMVL